jgi:RNA polymerase subunit RPABC4/transcription elongation factor Spt4
MTMLSKLQVCDVARCEAITGADKPACAEGVHRTRWYGSRVRLAARSSHPIKHWTVIIPARFAICQHTDIERYDHATCVSAGPASYINTRICLSIAGETQPQEGVCAHGSSGFRLRINPRL